MSINLIVGITMCLLNI